MIESESYIRVNILKELSEEIDPTTEIAELILSKDLSSEDKNITSEVEKSLKNTVIVNSDEKINAATLSDVINKSEESLNLFLNKKENKYFFFFKEVFLTTDR